MKCIDAIEGTVKSILNSMHLVCIEEGLDDSEYVRNAKAVIEGTKQFASNNPEVVDDPELLEHVLFVYSRSLWLAGIQPAVQGQAAKPEQIDAENEEYQTYYYDYLYNRGLYPR
jgi:hypothetical protein